MVIKIDQSQIIDWNVDGKTDWKELEALFKKYGYDTSEKIEYNGQEFKNFEEFGNSKVFQDLAGAAGSAEGLTPSEAEAKAAGLEVDFAVSEMDKLAAEIEQLQSQEAAEDVIKQKQLQLQKMIQNSSKLLTKSGKSLDLGKYKDAAGMEAYSAKAQITSGSQQQASGQAGANGAKAQTMSGSFSPPANWGAQTLGGVPSFSTDAYMKTMTMENNIMSSWDDINKNQNRGKQLMQLFFYFAKMAESGDMSSMYQFMKFITYIISKDKAKQQIEMGKKLIQLQELSRSWTNKLLNVSTDSSDPNASNELMKTMTVVKAETDAIATSQKLISQMMEEFAQVVETLTNTTKMALTTAGNIQRTVSKF